MATGEQRPARGRGDSARGDNRGGAARSKTQRPGGAKPGGRGPSGGRGSARPGTSQTEGPRQRSGPGGRTSGGPPRKFTTSKPATPARDGARGRDETEPIPGNRSWGGLARKGVLRANHDERRELEQKQERRRPDADLAPEELAKREAREANREAREMRTAQLRAEAKAAVERTGADLPKQRRPRKPKAAHERAPLPSRPARAGDEYELLSKMFGAATARKHMRKLNSAAEAFSAERYADAKRALEGLVEIAPSVPEIRELYGLTLYRQGRYREAAKHLEEFRVLAASTEQNPVLMDCYRSDQRWADVAELWDELSDTSPSGPIVGEGRIVMAGALADQGDIEAGVKLLAKGWKRPSTPREHHLRRAYALADLYERSGDVPRARALFEWLVSKDPSFVDVRTRLSNLR